MLLSEICKRSLAFRIEITNGEIGLQDLLQRRPVFKWVNRSRHPTAPPK